MKVLFTRVVGLILILGLSSAYGAQETTITLPGGQDLDVRQFSAVGDKLLLWLPSERGISPVFDNHANVLAASGVEVWIADLHSSYFVARNRNSLSQFPLNDIVALIDYAVMSSQKDVYLLSASRGAQLALIAAREWQLRAKKLEKLRGLVLIHANLYQGRPLPNQDSDYLPIVAASNLPVYLLDAEFSTKSLRIQALATALGQRGGRVYSQLLRGVQGGFYAREPDELEPAGTEASRKFPGTLLNAITLLALSSPPESAVVSSIPTTDLSTYRRAGLIMRKLENPFPARQINLLDLNGIQRVLNDFRGSVVLINFWASWCGPCVEEIPSLHRLEARFPKKSFKVISVNVGEQPDRIEKFMQKVPIKFPVLMDTDGSVAKAWGIYVYPSNYLIDAAGNIQYVHFGALEWDSRENIEIVNSLFDT